MMPVLGLHLLRFEDGAAKDVAPENRAAEGCELINRLGTVVALTPE